ncbi:MAG: hypothetical protein V3T64_06195 [Myxococcota bacterium]
MSHAQLSSGRVIRGGPGQWYYLEAGQVHGARFEVGTSEIEVWFQA